MTVRDLNTGRAPASLGGRAREINSRLEVLYAERTSRAQRGVALPPGLTEAIEVMERQLNNPHNREEADNMDEARFLELEPLRLPWYTGPWGACLLVVLALAAIFGYQWVRA